MAVVQIESSALEIESSKSNGEGRLTKDQGRFRC